MTYSSYQFFYPPRPEFAIHPKFLGKYDDGKWMAQPKLNGDSAIVFTNGKELIIKNRHKQDFKKNISSLEKVIKDFYSSLNFNGQWVVLFGEWMTKSKKDIYGNNFNDNFVLFDILVDKNVYLLGDTFEERITRLTNLIPEKFKFDSYITKTNTHGLYLVNIFYGKFNELYSEIVCIDMYEGLVLKKRNAPLEIGIKESNNISSQVKFRKETKNYHY